mgnify:CR=1 FL=1
MARKKAQKKTFIAIVLDESGSMQSMREAAVELFNGQAQQIRDNAAAGGDTKVSFFKFGCTAAPHTTEVFHAKPADELPTLESKDYVPQNGTPMRDGIGRAISKLEAEDDGHKNTAFLVIVVTDGQENQSSEWSAERMRNKVSALQATGRWTFAVYGANISLVDLQNTGGFTMDSLPTGNFAAYQPTERGLMVASAALGTATMTYMTSVRGVNSTTTTMFAK